jgi:anaerobic magnesium-protoporphyrin IX monomethyl ester cyclase
MVTDCLIIGYNDGEFSHEVDMMRAMGASHPDFRDLSLNYIEYQGRPYRAMDILDHFHYEGRPPIDKRRKFHNTEVLWMVVMYLGSYLARRGFSFDYVNLFQFQKEELREKLRTGRYLTAVVTTTIYNYDTPILEVVNFVREHSPETRVVVGGPYVAKRSESMEESDLEAVFKYVDADFYVRSREGEQALVRLIQALKGDQNFAAIPNLAYRQGDRFVLTPSEREFNTLYDNLIDYSLFPPDQVGSYVNVRITKGCPFTCSFCSFPLRTEKYDVSKLEYIERELNAIRDVGTVSGLFFVDDTANVPLQTFKEMMRMMIRQRYGFRWHCFFRADFCDAELVGLMAQAGCQGVFLGLESANDQMLINMHKTPRKRHYLSSIPLFKQAGIKVFASLFFGFPGETYASAQETIEFLEETKPDFYRPLVWYCDPVTPIWQERDRYGIRGYHFSWSHDTMDVSTACDLVESCFFRFDKPVWVPDPGFNFVSLFLLQNRGMSFDQIETFLHSWNAVVREKVLEPRRGEPSPQLIEALRRACQFDRPATTVPEAFEVLSADHFRRAEQFWRGEFAAPLSASGGAAGGAGLAGEANEAGDLWRKGPVLSLARPRLDSLERGCAVERGSLLLAALAAALLRLDGRTDLAVVVAGDEREPFPVRLAASERTTFRELAQAVQGKLAAAAPHRLYAPSLFASTFRIPGAMKAAPVFSVGYVEAASSRRQEEPAAGAPALFPRLDGGVDRDGPERFAVPAYRDVELILRAEERGDGLSLRLLARGEGPSPANEELGEALLGVLAAAAREPNVPLGDVPLAVVSHHESLPGRPLAALQFNF